MSINTGSSVLRYLALSTRVDLEACEYPDSQKVLVSNRAGLRKIFRAESNVDYYDRENTGEYPR